MKFFTPSGDKEINLIDFVEQYKEIYYYLNRNRKLEDFIDNFPNNNSEFDLEDIVNLMKWKTGGSKNGNLVTPPRSKHPIDCKQLFNYISENKALATESPKGFVQGLVGKVNTGSNDGIDGIGAVYAITILHIFSHGAYPIYDKFAHLALMAFEHEYKPVHVISDKELRGKFSDQRKNWFENYQTNFVTQFDYLKEELVKENSKNSARDLDKALWVYGHLFAENMTNKTASGIG